MNNMQKICLLGMSGVGKTYWSIQLEQLNYHRISCDELISDRIVKNLSDEKDFTLALGDWLGYPWNADFIDKEKIYLDYEQQFMKELSEQELPMPVILDSTGSIIYCPDSILQKIKDNFLMVYLSLTEEKKTELLNSYLQQPRPILWQGYFSSKAEIAENYLNLIETREKLYKKYAQVEIHYNALQKIKTAKEFLNLISTYE